LHCRASTSRLALKVGRLQVDRSGRESTRLAFGDGNDSLASVIENLEHACIVRTRLKPKVVLQRFVRNRAFHDATRSDEFEGDRQSSAYDSGLNGIGCVHCHPHANR
jgi:hypothetical protein